MMHATHKRRFERVDLPSSAPVFAEEQEVRLGRVRVLGQGGMLVETDKELPSGSPHQLTIVDESEDIRCEVVGVALYRANGGIGFEFKSLDVDAAVQIGVILGKYYMENKPE